jgi:hypothetical protein
LGGRGREISEFKASLVYRVSSRTARATQRNPVLEKKKKKKERKFRDRSLNSTEKTPRQVLTLSLGSTQQLSTARYQVRV